ncbi:uroporphyrinogen-III synthase [Amorphus sp. 3PC139-8]|uniref:uroporphyrinogen-III synthase n=1 Tax=Amorphus sp. 3PC139-8 TaxID=2735676 RepID=UPI00345DF617
MTRPMPQAEETADRLEAAGHEPVRAPLLEIVPDPTVSLAPCDADAIVLTSRGAVRAISLHPEKERIFSLPVFAVGDATARAARALGFGDVRSAGGDLAAVAERISAEEVKPHRLLHLAGRDRSGDLAALLRPAGIQVETRVVYRAEPATALPSDAAEALRAGTLDGVLSFSPRSAATLLTLAEAAGLKESLMRARHYCLSEAVADCLRDAGARDVAVAATPDQDALLALIPA